MRNRFLLLLSILTVSFSNLYSNVYVVTNTAGNGWWPACGDPGSFLEAVCNATTNPGRDTIEFNLAGGTVITSAKNPFAIDGTQSDLFINGLSQIDGNPITLGFSVTVTGTDVDFFGVNFSTVNHSLTLTGNNNGVDSCFFTVTGSGQNAVWINGGTGSTVTRSLFTASQLHAISIENGGGHTVDSCIATGITDVSIIARGTGGNIIKNCIVSAGSHNGIGVLSANNLIDSCVTFDLDRAGIVVDNSLGTGSGNVITNNVVYGNNKNLWMNAGTPDPNQGAVQTNGPSTTINGNWIYNNATNGIIAYTTASTNNIIRNNIVGRDALGNESGNGWNGIFVWEGNGAFVSGNLVVNNGKGASHGLYAMPDRISGIRFQEVSSGSISANYVGTDAAKANVGNDFDGITLHTTVSSIRVDSNIVCNNGLASTYGDGGGIALRNGANLNTFKANYVGLHADLSDGGNNDYGVSIEGCNGNVFGGALASDGNFIGYSKNTGNQGCGVWIVLTGATGNEFYNNNVSFNTGDGFLIERGAVGNKVGSLTAGNTINSNEIGINVKENGTGPNNYNTLRGNSFSCNTVKGIQLSDGGNDLYGGIGGSKIVTTNSSEARATFVSGTAPNNAAVDIYTVDQTCLVTCDGDTAQGVTYITTVTANGTGNWEFDFSSTPTLTKNNVIVMATDTVSGNQNSSEFSICKITCLPPQNVAISGTDEFCAGGQTTLTASSTGTMPTSDLRYTWYLGSVAPANLISSAINDDDIVVLTAGSYIVVIADTIDESVCVDQSSGFPVVVNPLPTLNVTAGATVCEGDSVLIESFGAGGTGPLSYSWTPNGETTQDIYVKSSNTYGVTVTDSVGCDTTGSAAATVTDTVVINLGPSSPEFCAGDSVTLTSGYTGGGTLLWTPTNESSTSIEAKVGGIHTLVITENGCTSTSSISVTENSNPTPSLDSGFFCQGEIDTLTVDLAGLNYLWSPGGEQTQSKEISVEGTYSVTVTDGNGCEGTATTFVDENDIVNPIVTLGEDTSICQPKGHTVNLAITYNGLAGGSILWSNGETDSIANYDDTVVVWVSYTDSLTCSGRDTLKIKNYCEPPIVDLPNVFVPGGTVNPIFTPIGNITPEDILNGHFVVYNRWGLKMYESTDEIVPQWDGTNDGKEVSDGVYYWIWIYKDVTFTEYNLNGFMQLIRSN